MVVPRTKTQNMLSDTFHILYEAPRSETSSYLSLSALGLDQRKKSEEYLLDKWLKSQVEKDIICKLMQNKKFSAWQKVKKLVIPLPSTDRNYIIQLLLILSFKQCLKEKKKILTSVNSKIVVWRRGNQKRQKLENGELKMMEKA